MPNDMNKRNDIPQAAASRRLSAQQSARQQQGAANGVPHVSMPIGEQARSDAAGKKRTIIVVVCCVVAALAVWLLVWLFACNGNSLFDSNAQTGQAPYKSAEEMQAELDRQVEEGMFNISIASAIQFADGTSSGTAYIENVPGNRYNMQVVITDDATKEVLYESGVLAPNQFIEEIGRAHV